MAVEIDFQRDQDDWRRKIDTANYAIDTVVKEIVEYGLDYYSVAECEEDFDKFAAHELPTFEDSFFNIQDTQFNLDFCRSDPYESSRKLVTDAPKTLRDSDPMCAQRKNLCQSNLCKPSIHTSRHSVNSSMSNGHLTGNIPGYTLSSNHAQGHNSHFELDHIGKSELLDDLEVELGWPLSLHPFTDIEHFPETHKSFGQSDSLEIPKLGNPINASTLKQPQIHEKSPTKDFVCCIVSALEDIQPATSQEVLSWLLHQGFIQLSQKMNYDSLKKKIQSMLGHKLYKEIFQKIPQQASTAALWQLQDCYKQALATNPDADSELDGVNQHLTIEHNEHIFGSQPEKQISTGTVSGVINTDSSSDVNEEDFDFHSENERTKDCVDQFGDEKNSTPLDEPHDDSSQLSGGGDSDEEIDVLEISDTNTDFLVHEKKQKIRHHHYHQRGQKRLNEESWNDHFRELLRFQSQYSHFSVPTKGEFEKLYQWIKRQRAAKRNNKASLTQERIKKLNDIGFPWQPDRKKMKSTGEEKTVSSVLDSKTLNEFIVHSPSHTNSDISPVSNSGCCTSSYKGPGVEHAIENGNGLENVNDRHLETNRFHDNGNDTDHSEESASSSMDMDDNDWLEEAKGPISSETISKKRQREPNSPLDYEIDDGINTHDYSIPCSSAHYHNRLNGERWDERFAELVNFYHEQGHCKVPRKGFPELNRWIHKQLFYYRQKSGAMTQDRYLKLQQVGFWDTYK